jgi:hypothetical protein
VWRRSGGGRQRRVLAEVVEGSADELVAGWLRRQKLTRAASCSRAGMTAHRAVEGAEPQATAGESKLVSEAARTAARAWARGRRVSDKARLEDDRDRGRQGASWGLGGPRGANSQARANRSRRIGFGGAGGYGNISAKPSAFGGAKISSDMAGFLKACLLSDARKYSFVEDEMRELVVDRNVIRRPSLFFNYNNDPELRFILPETFLVEALKNPREWEGTLRPDLEALIPVRARTRMACSVSEALRIEMAKKRAVVRKEWLAPEFQHLLDRLFDAVACGGDLYEREMDNIREIWPDLTAEQPAAAQPKERMEDIVKRTLEARLRTLGDKVLPDLRAGRLQGDAKLWIVETVARDDYVSDCKARGQTLLPWPDSLTARFFILKAWRGVWWLQKLGLASAKEHKLHNDGYDDEYVLVGSFFDGTLSEEKRVQEASADLMRVIASGPSNALAVAYQDYIATISGG